jgi:hypothetical protein
MVTRNTHAARIAFFASLLVLALALVPVAPAAKGRSGGGGGGSTTGSGGGTIDLVVLTSPGDGQPHVGYKVTFNVSTSATIYPWVTLDCYQNGTLVYHGSNGIFATSLNEVFTLASNSWKSGAANCTAYLQNWDAYSKHGTITNLASKNIDVLA